MCVYIDILHISVCAFAYIYIECEKKDLEKNRVCTCVHEGVKQLVIQLFSVVKITL